jgi:hypothetical protein
VHDVPSQTHAPAAQCRPDGQLPALHVPPQPSSAPQAFPAQLGVQPQTPLRPPPPQLRGAVHVAPAQHAWPLPPHVPQLPVPHTVPGAQAMHTAPPRPQEESLVPGLQTAPVQHPLHDDVSHVQTPALHRSPAGQTPFLHTPPQPSSAPHALLLQLGVQPHTPPLQISGALHAPLAQHG